MKTESNGRKFVITTDDGAQFEFRQPSVRKINKLNEQLQSSMKDRQVAIEPLATFIGALLFGWQGVKTDEADVAKLFGIDSEQGKVVLLPFKPELLADVLTVVELNEIFNLVMKAVNPAPSPNSESPVPSQPGSSAATAQAANAATSARGSSATSSKISPAISAAAEAAAPAVASVG